MGIYVYSMRKKTVNIVVDGNAVKANLFSYSYKEWWSFAFGKEQARREFIANNTERIGQAAFESPRSGYVVVGDAEDDHHGATVYKDVTRGTWVDTIDFPGTAVGFLHKEGKNLVMRDHSPWKRHNIIKENGETYPEEWRFVLVDGKTITERRIPTDVLGAV